MPWPESTEPSVYFGTKLDKSFAEKVRQCAKADNRTLSNYIRQQLIRAVREAGLLDKPQPEAE